MVDAYDGFDFDEDVLYIPINTIPNQGNVKYEGHGVNFYMPADFLIQIAGKDNSRIMVDAYYDANHYLNAKAEVIEPNLDYSEPNSGLFNPMMLTLSRELYLPQEKKTVPYSDYETGKLTYGNGNPESEEYNSMVDFIEKDGNVEIRIPWQLLNVMDPSTKHIIGDIYKNDGVEPLSLDSLYIGAGIKKKGQTEDIYISFAAYSWASWDMPTYHERLKDSYFILKDEFEKVGKSYK